MASGGPQTPVLPALPPPGEQRPGPRRRPHRPLRRRLPPPPQRRSARPPGARALHRLHERRAARQAPAHRGQRRRPARHADRGQGRGRARRGRRARASSTGATSRGSAPADWGLQPRCHPQYRALPRGDGRVEAPPAPPRARRARLDALASRPFDGSPRAGAGGCAPRSANASPGTNRSTTSRPSTSARRAAIRRRIRTHGAVAGACRTAARSLPTRLPAAGCCTTRQPRRYWEPAASRTHFVLTNRGDRVMSAVRTGRRPAPRRTTRWARAPRGLAAPKPATRQPQRLMRSVLGPVDIAASTMANIAPAMSFYFGFGFLALTAGIASPLTIIAAGVAIAFLGNTLAQFSRAHPSTGSFITFIGKAFGPTSAIATAVILITGYVIAIISVLVMSGGFTAIFLNHYLPAFPTSSWPWFMVVFISLAAFLMVRGIHISTRWAGDLFRLRDHRAGRRDDQRPRPPRRPPDPASLRAALPVERLQGTGLGFPLAVYLFIGWENSATLAEETENPRRNVPRALFASVALMMVSYVLFAYATVEGFGENVAALTRVADPVHHRGRQRARCPCLLCLPGRRHLDARLPDRGGELPVAAALQRRPRGPAARVAGPRLRAPSDAGERPADVHRHRLRAGVRLVGRPASRPRDPVRRGLDARHHPRARGLLRRQPRPAGLLPQAPSRPALARSGTSSSRSSGRR